MHEPLLHCVFWDTDCCCGDCIGGIGGIGIGCPLKLNGNWFGKWIIKGWSLNGNWFGNVIGGIMILGNCGLNENENGNWRWKWLIGIGIGGNCCGCDCSCSCGCHEYQVSAFALAWAPIIDNAATTAKLIVGLTTRFNTFNE